MRDSKIGKHGTLLPQFVKTDSDKINLYFYVYFITWLKFGAAGSRCVTSRPSPPFAWEPGVIEDVVLRVIICWWQTNETSQTTFTVAFLGVVLMTAASAVCAIPNQQSEQRKASPTLAEQNAFQAAHTEKDAQTRIDLLDDFTARYPESTLLPDVYVNYYQAYLSLWNSPQSVEYIDKFIALGDTIELATRLGASVRRAQIYFVGCNDTRFQTPETYTKVKVAAAQGSQILGEFQKSQDEKSILTFAVSDAQFYSEINYIRGLFTSVGELADFGLQGDKADACKTPPAVAGDPGKFNRMLDQINSDERQPRVQ